MIVAVMIPDNFHVSGHQELALAMYVCMYVMYVCMYACMYV